MTTMIAVEYTTKEFPAIKIGDRVQAMEKLTDATDRAIVAKKGDRGFVIGMGEGELPTVYWERTGRYMDAVPNEEFKVVLSVDLWKPQGIEVNVTKNRKGFVTYAESRILPSFTFNLWADRCHHELEAQ